ncbi:hypothetical protein LOK49_LG13G01655 [Camellia lanceoleosa]|uniref:Uncharacterized protein n=1 Tax=Camellia lanceoleosa TaxID=1840588 RepID=A0ACC0FG21_9ERIC|nr:hypothetical protein LOK49_LG13G01655 [Camellia lanceoleosa]
MELRDTAMELVFGCCPEVWRELGGGCFRSLHGMELKGSHGVGVWVLTSGGAAEVLGVVQRGGSRGGCWSRLGVRRGVVAEVLWLVWSCGDVAEVSCSPWSCSGLGGGV